jgi:cell division protein FtsQ
MLISGKVDVKNKKKVALLLDKINSDDFMKKNIIGMQVLDNDDVILANRNYDFQIEFGKIAHIEAKILKYKAFFQKANQDDVLKKYKKINLKFTHQVVCTK